MKVQLVSVGEEELYIPPPLEGRVAAEGQLVTVGEEE